MTYNVHDRAYKHLNKIHYIHIHIMAICMVYMGMLLTFFLNNLN
jgi:hypothetical protein